MKLKARNFPHPVLNPVSDDFRKGFFKGKIVSQSEENGLLVFIVEFILENSKLKELVETGKAIYNVHFECVSTMQRRTFSLSNPTNKISIPKNLMNKKIDVNFFVLAKEEIRNYSNVDAHIDFMGVNFNIQKGDILAFCDSQTIHIEKKPMSNTNSIFKVSKDTSPQAPAIKIAFNDHQINIALPEVSFDKVSHLKAFGDDCNKILVSLLYLPALIETLFSIQSIAQDEYSLEEIENLDWYRTLEKKLQTMGYNIIDLKLEDITGISYELLNSSKEAALVSLENIVYLEGADNE
ncbi:hypothetical protein [Neobacillus sp. PS2-9]|uniref:hypothetical protein n=1 Tax=Neobacillus sp. PS2-9 TaxID=3070676 RepID=UPI0027E0AF27|nr:hypothetical protein [Neobacillus sp. PS2-9]WML57755.1 hypothetical protein RCG25_23100 [Neobacillus sp. PS2-9]